MQARELEAEPSEESPKVAGIFVWEDLGADFIRELRPAPKPACLWIRLYYLMCAWITLAITA